MESNKDDDLEMLLKSLVSDDDSFQEPSQENFDMQESGTFETSELLGDDEGDLISRLDEIFNDTENEVEEHTEDVANESISNESFDISDLQLDDEFKELLGINDEQVMETAEESIGLTEEDLARIADIETEVLASETKNDDNNLDSEFENNEDEGLTDFLNMFSDAGDESAVTSEAEAASAGNKKADKVSKESFINRIFSVFKRKDKKKGESDSVNENQQVLNELFDENGELLGDNTKATKKGLFSKASKKSDSKMDIAKNSSVSTDITDELSELVSLDEASEDAASKKNKKKKEKVKKEKPKKEKVKKPKKPKIEKIKKPVEPHELIKVKPGAVLIILVLAAAVSSVAYLFIQFFTYNQSLDSATYYLVDKKYTFAYEAIAGVEPKSDEDKALVEQIETIMFVQKQYNSYERYLKMNMPIEALDSLIKGISKYDKYISNAVEIGVEEDMENVKTLIVEKLWIEYGITEDMARSYNLLTDPEQYNFILETYGGRIDDSNN